jgi:hypothetical protein
MSYKKIKEMLNDLSDEELEIEDEKIHGRRDKKNDKLIGKKMRESGVLHGSHLKEEKCLCCNLPLDECPMKNEILKERRKK